jgi:hypothetical protein
MKSGENNLKYPSTFNCEGVYSNFGTLQGTGKHAKYVFTTAEMKNFKHYALLD